MINENRNRNAVSFLAVILGVILASVGSVVPGGLGQSIVVNIASNFITTGLFSFFIIDRILLAQENKNRRLLAARENEVTERNQQKIDVFFVGKESHEKFKLPLELLRGEFSRGEVLARIGMLPMKDEGKRFSIEYMGTPEFFREINDILANYKRTELLILCRQEEIERFKMHESYKVKEEAPS
jgi:hypothetical protein